MELGSNFDINIPNLSPQEDNFYGYIQTYNTIFFDSARSGLRFLLKQLNCGMALLPSYICDSVTACFDKKQLLFYKINEDFSIDMDDFREKLRQGIGIVYLMHYFGALQSSAILKELQLLKEQYDFVIIEDTTHSIFTKCHTIGDYCICSLRKWFPIPNGGVLYSNEQIPGEEQTVQFERRTAGTVFEAMILKHLFLKENLDCNSMYRKKFVSEELFLDNTEEVFRISRISEELLNCFSISELKQKRKENLKILCDFLQEKGYSNVLRGDGFVPLTCPVYMENRDEFRSYLMENRIYCAVHWPLSDSIENPWIEQVQNMSEHMISLPIDQRYGEKELEYMKKVIENYIGH